MPAGAQNGSWSLTQRAMTSHGEIAFDVLGLGAPVVLVHGTPSRSFVWRNIAPALAERYAVHVYDLLGYGDSELEVEFSERIERRLPNATRTVLAEAGHFAMVPRTPSL